MPKDVVTGARVRMAQMGDRMYKVVACSLRPERALKDEVFRLCDTMPPKEVGAVLGRVYGRLGNRKSTVSMAEYMKELYGNGSRRLFVPKPLVGIRRFAQEKPGLIQIKIKGKEMELPPKQSKQGTKKAINAFPSGSGGSDNVVNLKSITDYCLNTASRYFEVKPVYDMLMELYSKNPTKAKEWLEVKEKIKAHMDTLPMGSYMVVNGDYVEHKQIANNVENVEADGVGIVEKPAPTVSKKDGRKKADRTEKVVKAVYQYNFLKEEDAYKRLAVLYQALMEKKWIDKTTTPDMFIDLFTGEPKDFYIKWTGSQADLYALIKNLFKANLISATKGGGKWETAGSHFVNKQSKSFTNWNKQKENLGSKTTIEYFVKILNPHILIDEKLLKILGLA